jgi:hypothetical protein
MARTTDAPAPAMLVPLLERAARNGRLIEAHRLLVDSYGPDVAIAAQRAWTDAIVAEVLTVPERRAEPPEPGADVWATLRRLRATMPALRDARRGRR